MHDFSFNGISLRSLGGRITEAPFHTVASRDVDQVKIYGQSGDEVIDNQSYNNVSFSVKIAFLTYKTAMTANDIARAVIDWLAPLQGAYYTYTDSWNEGYFTKARLTNFDEVKRELRTLLTATLKFSRVPFWYSNSGLTPVEFVNGNADNVLHNPESYDAEPIYQFISARTSGDTVNVTVNGQTGSALLSDSDYPRNTIYCFDNVRRQFYFEAAGQKHYLSAVLLPDLQPGDNTIRFNLNGSLTTGSFSLMVIPNWRRL